MQQDNAQQFLSNIDIYGKPVLGSGRTDLFAGGFNKDQLAKFWLGNFAPFAVDSARGKRDSNRVNLSENAIATFDEQELRGQQAYGQFGGNPELFLRGQEQRRSGVRGQLAGISAGVNSEYTSDVFSSLAGASQQASAAVLHQKSLDQQRYLAEEARKSIEKARKDARRGSYIQAIGAVVTAVASYYSGGAAAVGGGALVSSLGSSRKAANQNAIQAFEGGLYNGLIDSPNPSVNFWGNVANDNFGSFPLSQDSAGSGNAFFNDNLVK